MKIRILSYNVHKFFNLMKTRYFLATLKEYFSAMDLDVVFLQEITGHQPTRYRDQFVLDPLEHLADEIWDHYIYGKNAVYSSGHHGNAILSKYPVQAWENINISNHRWESRSLLKANIQIQNQNITLACTHLDLTRRGRANQAKKISSILELDHSSSSPLVLGGDFNDWKGDIAQTFREKGLTDVFSHGEEKMSYTFPGVFPVLPLDKMFYRNLKCTRQAVLNEPRWKKLSDHLPIFAEFELLLK